MVEAQITETSKENNVPVTNQPPISKFRFKMGKPQNNSKPLVVENLDKPITSEKPIQKKKILKVNPIVCSKVETKPVVISKKQNKIRPGLAIYKPQLVLEHTGTISSTEVYKNDQYKDRILFERLKEQETQTIQSKQNRSCQTEGTDSKIAMNCSLEIHNEPLPLIDQNELKDNSQTKIDSGDWKKSFYKTYQDAELDPEFQRFICSSANCIEKLLEDSHFKNQLKRKTEARINKILISKFNTKWISKYFKDIRYFKNDLDSLLAEVNSESSNCIEFGGDSAIIFIKIIRCIQVKNLLVFLNEILLHGNLAHLICIYKIEQVSVVAKSFSVVSASKVLLFDVQFRNELLYLVNEEDEFQVFSLKRGWIMDSPDVLLKNFRVQMGK